ncbi:MAG TPA: MmcB family DNA repair protein [Aestuariivirga sp.]|nr:MmcB family DNA repair protein [Aestuariivirga sp.]
MTLQLRQDGRQSDTALMVQKGVRRLLRQAGFATLTEFSLVTGRRADVIALNEGGAIWIVEIKSSLQDFRCDGKWPEYQGFCDRLFFAIPQTLDHTIMPLEAGLIVADKWGADILRHPGETPLHASRRKAVTLAFARAAALTLHGLYDPAADF